ncbi:unnamed protein product [Echinostoma caproni]|uniref:EGF-like domain-containing protein n=1 Tax=Echinostoma caproni TaxID=27848 RepID=A0A183AFC3_9TREM|nr:unnamed protein product [Echinostoma caproni]
MGRNYQGEPKCVPMDMLCNGHPDCPAGDDESDGPRTNCTKIDSCEINNGGCSQLCSSVNGHAKCDCAPGYLSLPDAPRSCIARGDKAILYTTHGQLYQRFLGKNITRVLQFGVGSSTSNASVLIPTVQWRLATSFPDSPGEPAAHVNGLWSSLSDFDYAFDRTALTRLSEPLSLLFVHGSGLFDTTTMRHNMVSTPSGSSVRRKRHQPQYLHPLAVRPQLVPIGVRTDSEHEIHPLALAYDWVHNLIFWTNGTSGTIHVTHRASGWSKRLIQLTEGSQPLGIVVDPRFARLYWITRGRQSMIEMMDMDGQNRQTLVTDQMQSPYSLTLDYIRNEIYWADGSRGSVDAYDLDRGTRRTVIQSDDYYPVWVAVFEDWVYWSDRKQNALFRANKMTGADPESMFSIPDPLSFRLQHDLLRPVWVNRCTRHRCQQLCLPVPLRSYPNYSDPFRCACAEGWQVDPSDPTRCRIIVSTNGTETISEMAFSPIDPDTFWDERASFLREWIGRRMRAATTEADQMTFVSGSFIPIAILLALLVACLLGLGASYVAFRNYRKHLNRQLGAHLAAAASSEAKLLLNAGPFNQSMDEPRPWGNDSSQDPIELDPEERPRVQFHVHSSATLLNQKPDTEC